MRYAPTLALLKRGADRGGGACVDVLALPARTRTRSLMYDEVFAPQGIRSQIFAIAEFRGAPVFNLFVCRHGRGTSFDEDDAASVARSLRTLAAAHIAVEWAHAARSLELLSAREREIAALVSRGLRTREIAEVLGTSPNTVRNQTAKIFAKLEVTTRAELASLVRGG
jgi:DNA-binding CsgD family transcriptional regulator